MLTDKGEKRRKFFKREYDVRITKPHLIMFILNLTYYLFCEDTYLLLLFILLGYLGPSGSATVAHDRIQVSELRQATSGFRR